MRKTPQEIRAVHWIWTWNADEAAGDDVKWATTGDVDPVKLYDDKKFACLVYQVEKAPTPSADHPSGIHLQGFCSMLKKSRRAQVVAALGGHVWCDMARTPKEACMYAQKEGRVAGPFVYGTLPDNRGKLSPTARAVQMIQEGTCLSAVAAAEPLAWTRSYRGLQSLHAELSKPKETYYKPTKVTVLWGPTRTGKTRTALAHRCADGRLPYCMPASNGLWFDGYSGEDTLVLDDFYGQIKFSDMLRILDDQSIQVPIKGSFTWSKWTTVFITSNAHPDDWWKGARDAIPADSIMAMMARLGTITHVPRPLVFDDDSGVRADGPVASTSTAGVDTADDSCMMPFVVDEPDVPAVPPPMKKQKTKLTCKAVPLHTN